MNLPTLSAQTHAWLRHVYTGLGTATAMAVTFALLSSDDQQKITDAVQQIGNGIEMILGGLGVLVPIASALYARFTAKPAQQIKAVNALPDKQVISVPPPAQ